MFSKAWDPLVDMPDMHGKVALVTGGNQGIGYATIKFLALAGAKVYMVSRSEAKGQQALKELHRENPKLEKGSIAFLKLDLADIRSVVAAADEVRKKESRLDVLVNNGATVQETLEKTDAGFEITIATNHIGHFVLVDRLLPLMKQTALQPGSDVRIVVVTSNSHSKFLPPNYSYNFSSPSSLTDSGTPHPERWPVSPHLVRYAISKGANTLFAAELQRRLDTQGANIIVTSVHPGGVNSPGTSQVFFPIVMPLVRLMLVSIDKGAVTLLFAATAAEVRDKQGIYAGQYLVPYGRLGSPHRDMKSEEVALDLWNTTRNGVNEYLTSHGIDSLSM